MKSQVESLEPYLDKVIIIPLTGNTSFSTVRKAVFKCKELIQKEKIDIVHPLYGSMTSYIGKLSKGNKPMVTSFCGDDLLGSQNKGLVWSIRNRLMIRLSKISAKASDAIIVKSTNLYQALSKKNQKRTSIIPNGVNLSVFKINDKEESRKSLGWNQGDKIVVFNPSSGANRAVKNLPLAQETIVQVNKKIGVKLELIENKTPEEVRLMMNAADAILVTSLHEGSPNIVKEAMAVNLPVITVNCGDVKERLRGVSNSYVVPTYDADQLADKLKLVLKADARSNGREVLQEQGLNTDAVRDKILSIYQKIEKNA